MMFSKWTVKEVHLGRGIKKHCSYLRDYFIYFRCELERMKKEVIK